MRKSPIHFNPANTIEVSKKSSTKTCNLYACHWLNVKREEAAICVSSTRDSKLNIRHALLD